jgi:Uma2 family endonuclease
MATLSASPPPPLTAPPAQRDRFVKLPDFFDALGGIPLDRIVMNPLPGTATVQDCLEYGERIAPAELVDRTIVEKKMGYWEEKIGTELATDLNMHRRQRNLGGIVNGAAAQMRVATGNVRLPDVTYVTAERAPTRDEPVPELSPDLIVEVLSDSNTPREIERKLQEFFQGGTRLAWVIDRRKRTVAVHRETLEAVTVLGPDDTLSGDDVLPGFEIAVATLFEGIPTD